MYKKKSNMVKKVENNFVGFENGYECEILQGLRNFASLVKLQGCSALLLSFAFFFHFLTHSSEFNLDSP